MKIKNFQSGICADAQSPLNGRPPGGGRMRGKMKVIGITGGVGAGKSEVLGMLKEVCRCRIIYADDVGNKVKEPGEACYEEIVRLLGSGILKEDGMIDRKKMAEKIFADKFLLQEVNAVIHPAVKKYILNEIEEEQRKGLVDYFFVEAALLIEEGYDKICDELWYIYADEEIRRQRLVLSRGYSGEKIRQIMSHQRRREEFEAYCKVTIDNSKDREYTRTQIYNYLHQRENL